MLRRGLGALLIVALVGVAGSSRAALERLKAARPTEQELLYLPNGKYMRLLSLGQANLLADVMYLWAIQHYSNYERAHRPRYVKHVFSEVITELDPHYIDAYWLGALILIVENADLEAGLELLDKGARNNPRAWILPYLAAWECYHARQFDRARGYFERASRVEGAPTVVRRMGAGLVARAGEAEQALATWREILVDPESDTLSVKIARRKIAELESRIASESLQRAVERFRNDNGRWPTRLEELVERSYIGAVPRDASGRPPAYDRTTGRVSSAAARVLGES